jgi:TolB protein
VKHIILYFLLLTNMLVAVDATIDVIKEVKSNFKVAIESYYEGDGAKSIASDIKSMLDTDLKVASFYKVVNTDFEDTFDSPLSVLRYREKHIDYVIRSKSYFESNRLLTRFEVHNVALNEKVYSKEYSVGNSERYPFLTHKFIIDFSKEQGFDPLDWMDEFVIFSRNIGPKRSEIVIGDYTLTFTQVVVRRGLSIFPKWEDDRQRSFYYTDATITPTLYHVNFDSGKRTEILKSDGMLVCSDVSKDGENLLVTMAPNDQADIYVYNKKSKTSERQTKFRGIDVSANFVENDEAIVFVSDRLGKPNIFYKRIGEDAVTQMVYQGQSNNFCTTWENYIVFVSRNSHSAFSDNKFNLYMISSKTNYLRQLTTTGKNLFPKFSDSGDTLLYIKHYENETALGIIRLAYNRSWFFPLNVGKIQSIDW